MNQPVSSRCAGDILRQWYGGDNVSLARLLARAASMDTETGPDSHELERLELLSAIATRLQMVLETGQRHQIGALLPLLEHLAGVPAAYGPVRSGTR